MKKMEKSELKQKINRLVSKAERLKEDLSDLIRQIDRVGEKK